jgi:hypothetical protein
VANGLSLAFVRTQRVDGRRQPGRDGKQKPKI